jgi:hypothetical protein
MLLATLSSEDEFALGLSAQVVLPILHRLVKNADSLAEEGGGQTGRRLPGSTMRLTHEASATELVRGASRITS